MLFTVAHELTHFIRQWSPDKFQKLAEYVFRHSKLKGKASALVAAKMEGGKLSYDEAYEEVVADAMESILTSGKVMQQMMADIKANDRSLLANTLEAAITDETERKRLQEYKRNIAEADEQERKLQRKSPLTLLLFCCMMDKTRKGECRREGTAY